MESAEDRGGEDSNANAQETVVSRLFDEFLAAAERGAPIDIAELCRAHPEHADELRERYDAWCLIQRAVGPGGESIRITGASTTDSAWKAFLAQLESRGPAHSRYVFQGELARGGMGVIQRVFDQDAQRTLAMKVVLGSEEGARTGNTPAVDDRSLGRFLEEAQVTSQLDHPGIVPVHEIGVDAAKNVYFTMKLVKGEDLRFVIERVHDAADPDWNLPRAIGVVQRVCEAMAYAHAKGVIHRDLKPGNIMVGRFGEVYVMDWGLARVRGRKDERDIRIRPVETDSLQSERRKSAGETPDQALLTMDGQVLGTPAYMPPEQAEGKIDDVDEQSDVYAIGAILYHLIGGEMPFVKKGTQASNRTILARVLDGPPKPLLDLAPQTPAELLAIVERAMGRAKSERYASMAALGDDLRAYLEHRVVQAYQTGAFAEARKWVERNRALAASLAAVVLLLVAGLWTSLVFKADAEENAQLAEKRRGEAEVARAQAQADKEAAEKSAEETKIVAEFQSRMLSELSVDEFGHTIMVALRNDLEENLKRLGKNEEEVSAALATFTEVLRPGNPTNVAQRVLEVSVFEPAVQTIESDFADRPLVAAMLQLPLASTLHEVGLYEIGARVAGAALDIRRAQLGESHPDSRKAVGILIKLMLKTGRLPEAEAMSRKMLADCRASCGETHPDTIASTLILATVLHWRGDLPGAEALYREVLAGKRNMHGADHPSMLQTIANLAGVLLAQGKNFEAEPLFLEALAGRRAILGENHRSTIESIGALASLDRAQGRLPDAEAATRVALDARRAKLGDDHPDTLESIHNLGVLLQEQRKLSDAEPICREALAGRRTKLGDDHPDTLASIHSIAALLREQGKVLEAEPLCREALAGRQVKLGEDHPDTLHSMQSLALLLQTQGKLSEAEQLFREVLLRRRAVLGGHHADTLLSVGFLAFLNIDQGRFPDAESLLRELLDGRRATVGDDHPDTLTCLNLLARLLHVQGKLSEAVLAYREALNVQLALLGGEHPNTLDTEGKIAVILESLGRHDEAEPMFQKALAGHRAKFGDDHELSQRLIRLTIAHYEKRHSADSIAGHDAKAAELRKLLKDSKP